MPCSKERQPLLAKFHRVKILVVPLWVCVVISITNDIVPTAVASEILLFALFLCYVGRVIKNQGHG